MKKKNSSHLFTDQTMPISIVRLSILEGLGIPSKELGSKPFIGIANSWSELNPGHKHLRTLSQSVREGILAGGGIPFEFNVPAPCDGIANATNGMKYILAQRDLIADIIETYVMSQFFDGMVTISSCDKINPGMLMAAARLNIPTICLPGGPNMMKARFNPETKSLDPKDYTDLRHKLDTATCATCGSCELLATANTMQILTEVLGMALPGVSCEPAFSSNKMKLAWESGKRVVELTNEELCPTNVMTREALENAVITDLAAGGSTNSTIHLQAIARELDIDLDLEIFNKFNIKIPTICSIAPNGPHGIVDLFMAGGVPALMKRLKSKLHLECINVSGQTIGSIADSASILDNTVIRTLEEPFFKEGALAILKGNLSPDGCVIKQSAVNSDMFTFEGKARVFDGEQDVLQAISSGTIEPNTVLVIRYEGPKGGPGMPEMLSVTALLDFINMEKVALVTDGRFSGASKGPCVGHISPEAYDGGPIAAIEDGDIIRIDVPNRKIEVDITEQEIQKRLKGFKPLEKPFKKGYMKRYRKMVGSASRGAVLENF